MPPDPKRGHGKSPKKAGRPKKPPGEKRENVLRVKLTDDERELLDKFATSLAMQTATWARALLVAEARRAQGASPRPDSGRPSG